MLDRNEHTPVFSETDGYSCTFAEDSPVDSECVIIEATDGDTSGNKVTFSAVGGATDIFSIDASSGRVALKGTLDYEDRTEYTLNVRASDSGEPTRSADTTVTVVVTDVNDGAPVFTERKHVVTLAEGTSKGAVLYSIAATDTDSDTNAELIFSVVDDVDANLLNVVAGPAGTRKDGITTWTADIVLAGVLDFEFKKEFVSLPPSLYSSYRRHLNTVHKSEGLHPHLVSYVSYEYFDL